MKINTSVFNYWNSGDLSIRNLITEIQLPTSLIRNNKEDKNQHFQPPFKYFGTLGDVGVSHRLHPHHREAGGTILPVLTKNHQYRGQDLFAKAMDDTRTPAQSYEFHVRALADMCS